MATKKRTMRPKEKALWVRALLSGKYKQGEGELRTFSGKYCCLGVACKAISGVEPAQGTAYLRHNRFGLSTRLQCALANANDGDSDREESFKRAGFSTYPGRSGRKATFKTIANWISKNL